MRSWEKLSNPKVLQQNLVLAGLYLVAYDLLHGSIVDRLRNFFSSGTLSFSPRGTLVGTPDAEYSTKVLALHPKDTFHASCLWLLESQALSDEDLVEIRGIRDHRNELAHELASFIVDVERELDVRRLQQIRQLVEKVERWWIREVDIPTNPEYDGRAIADEDIRPGPVLFLDMIVATALQAGEDRSH